MMETWKMWRLVRYLKKNQHWFIEWDDNIDNIDIEGSVDAGTPIFRRMQTLANIAMQTRCPRGPRFVLAKVFGEELYRKRFPPIDPLRDLGEEVKKTRNDFSEKSVVDAQQRISDCIHKGFIDEDVENKQLVFLTLQGRKFATPYGLVKEWVMEDIGEMRSIIGAIIGTAALIKLRVIWDSIRGIFFALVVFSQ